MLVLGEGPLPIGAESLGEQTSARAGGPSLSACFLASAPGAQPALCRAQSPRSLYSFPKKQHVVGLGASGVFPLPGPSSLLPGISLPAGCKDSEMSLCGSSQPRAISHCLVVIDPIVCCWVCCTMWPSCSPTPSLACVLSRLPRQGCPGVFVMLSRGQQWLGVGCPSRASDGTGSSSGNQSCLELFCGPPSSPVDESTSPGTHTSARVTVRCRGSQDRALPPLAPPPPLCLGTRVKTNQKQQNTNTCLLLVLELSLGERENL